MLRFSVRLACLAASHPEPSQLQPIELCFHDDFVAAPDRPLSLHLCGRQPVRILQYDAPLLQLPSPTRPHYIHEIAHVVDLTSDSPPPTPSPSPSPSLLPPPSPLHLPLQPRTLRPRPRLSAWLLLAAFCAGLAARFLVSPAVFVVAAGRILARNLVTAPEGLIYRVNFTDTAESLALYRAVAPLERLRASLSEPVHDALTAPDADFLRTLSVIINHTCLNLTSPLSCDPSLAPPHSAPDLALTCRLLNRRVYNLGALWSRLSSATAAPPTSRNLLFTSLLLEAASDTPPFVRAYRKGLFGRIDGDENLAWAASPCQLCSAAGDGDEQKRLATAWHFACDLAFVDQSNPSAGPGNASTAGIANYLELWAKQRLAHRRSMLQNAAPGPVDPLQLVAKDPDVALPALSSEDELVAITRHPVELSAGIHELVS
ncbi:hypothetical protein ColTof4_14021 [Colletotrichum tofieldiae]|nr:hypothetical protein ColTof3_14655 [Colletotrichum tofieldiae]GKT81598.1 hypothetical protein ColTof4_14021 [Colletotrichum tofieldiae]